MQRNFVTALAVAAGLAVAALLTWTSLLRPSTPSAISYESIREIQDLSRGRTRLRGFINDSSRFESHIRELTQTAALAGSESAMHQVEYVENFWRGLGFKVVRRTYEIPMSYFNLSEAQPPSISICERVEDTTESCSPLELDKPLTPEDSKIIGLSKSYYTYSKPLSGDFRFLRLEDLENKEEAELVSALSQSLVLVPANETIKMEILMRMAVNLSTGFLLMHKPPGAADDGNITLVPEPAYPSGIGSPDTAITFYLGDENVGDPTTPGYPSMRYAVRRVPTDGLEGMLNTTVVPISNFDADRLIKAFKGPENGEQLEVPMRFLRIHWPLQFGYRKVHDSCAEVPGSVEPDRVVLLASHRDAWYGGAIDPHTGVATMLETSRALSEMMKDGLWRPRRTILMCAWDAEEIGLIGSVEWVEEEYQRAGARLVAYLNTDTDIMGNWKILVQASEQMVDTVREIMSEIPNPTGSLRMLPPASPYFFFLPLDDASDYYPFTRALGVPACDLSYIRGPNEALVLYDLYHTRYETTQLYRRMDPSGLAHQGLTQSVAAILYTFVDSPILPLNMSAFADGLRKQVDEKFLNNEENESGATTESNSTGFEDFMLSNTTTTELEQLLIVMRSALSNATKALQRFELRRMELSRVGENPLEQRMLNDKIMLVQKAFTHHCVFPCDGQSINLLNPPSSSDKSVPPEKIAEAFILGLNSVSKILTDSFVEY